MQKMTGKQQAEFLAKQQGHQIPAAPKSHMTDDVIAYIRQAAQTLTSSAFAETLAKVLKEPKLYLVKAVVANIPTDVILNILSKTIDIQSIGGMLLSEAAVELHANQSTTASQNSAAASVTTGEDKRKKSAGGVFLTLMKKDARVTPEMRRKVFKSENEQRRQTKFNNSLLTTLSLSCPSNETSFETTNGAATT